VPAGLAAAAPGATPEAITERGLPTEQSTITRSLEPVATFAGPTPTGVTVPTTGRIFVCFPRWGDDVQATVVEVKNGEIGRTALADDLRRRPYCHFRVPVDARPVRLR
jgi:hypothetical protein